MRSPEAPTRRAWYIVGGIAACSFLASLLIGQWLFSNMSANNDDAVYVFQAKTIANGSLTLPADAHADFFRPWMSGPQDGRQVLVFQPVFPATLALSEVLFGTMRVVPAAITAGCVLLIFAFAHAALRDERKAIIAAALFAVAPLVLVHSGMYLEYLYAVLLELAVLVLVLRASWGNATRRLVTAGLLHGLLFFMRPMDALLLGLVIVVMHAIPRPARTSDAIRRVVTVALAAIPGVLLCLAYNQAVTGHALRFPLWAIGGDNSLGFGKRSIAAGAPVIDFGFHDAWIAIRQNLRSFPHWVTGGLAAVPLGLYGLWRMPRDRVVTALVAIGVLFPLGYLAYWGNVLIFFGRRTIGPHYYLALLIPACLVVAAGLDACVRHGRAVRSVAVIALLVGTGIELPDKIDRNQAVAERIAAEDKTIDEAVGAGPAVVVLPITRDGPYVLHPRGWLMNEPDLSNPVLYAADRGGDNVTLFDRYPDRPIWRFQTVDTPEKRAEPDMQRLRRIEIDPTRPIEVTIRNTAAQPVVVLRMSTGVADATCVLDTAAQAGSSYRLALTIDQRGASVDCPTGAVTAALRDGHGTLALGAAFGPNEDTGFSSVDEYRIWYGNRAGTTSVIAPAEQWHRDPAPMQGWRVTIDSPAIALSVG